MNEIKFNLFLIILCVRGGIDPYKRRELKGGRSGGGRRSSRSGSYVKVTNGVYGYSTYKNPLVRTNSYSDGGKTYKELYVYYLPSNYYNVDGYLS